MPTILLRSAPMYMLITHLSYRPSAHTHKHGYIGTSLHATSTGYIYPLFMHVIVPKKTHLCMPIILPIQYSHYDNHDHRGPFGLYYVHDQRSLYCQYYVDSQRSIAIIMGFDGGIYTAIITGIIIGVYMAIITGMARGLRHHNR
jgi:hypothetical protein